MKAILIHQFGGVSELKIEDVPKPTPNEGEVLIKVRAAGLNPVDWKIRKGLLASRVPHTFPIIPGWDLSGIVEEVGYSVKRFHPGDEVYAYIRRPVISKGSYAEYVTVPESYISKKPYNLSFEEAAAIPLAGLTAYQSLFEKVKLKPKETVFILGASGGVGSFAVQFANAVGAKVITLASEKNKSYLLEIGAHSFIDYTKGDWLTELKKLEPNGVDVVFDCFGGSTQLSGFECVKENGRFVSILALQDHKKSRPDIQVHYHFVEPNAVQLDRIRAWAESRIVKVKLSKVYTMEEIQEAHLVLEDLHTTGKLVLTIN